MAVTLFRGSDVSGVAPKLTTSRASHLPKIVGPVARGALLPPFLGLHDDFDELVRAVKVIVRRPSRERLCNIIECYEQERQAGCRGKSSGTTSPMKRTPAFRRNDGRCTVR